MYHFIISISRKCVIAICFAAFYAGSNRLPRQEGRVGARLYFVEEFCIIYTIRKEEKRE